MHRPTNRLVPGRQASGLFSFLLLGVFALLSLLLVLIGAQVYQRVISSAKAHGEARAGLSYLIHKVHAYDTAGGVQIAAGAQGDMLVFTETRGETPYQVCIYEADGALYEYYGPAGEQADLSLGEKIVEAHDFTLEQREPGLLYIALTDSSGQRRGVHVRINSAPASLSG